MILHQRKAIIWSAIAAISSHLKLGTLLLAWGGLLCFSQKRLCKIKYGAESSISNVDLGLC